MHVDWKSWVLALIITLEAYDLQLEARFLELERRMTDAEARLTAGGL